MTKTVKNILIFGFMFIILFTLASCKDNNYRTFIFYNIQSSEGNVPSVLLSEYKNTKYDIYENKLVYHDDFNTKTYKYKFNNGYLEVQNQKDVTYQIKDDKLYVDIKFGNQDIRIVYKVEK